jgi:hypothetical protein
MIKFSEQLYRDVFVKTGGFMLNWPFGRQVKIGDFFALRPGNIGIVGNIYDSYFQLSIKDTFDKDIYKFQAPVLEPYLDEKGGWEVFSPAPYLWTLRNGCTSNYSSDKFVREHKRKVVSPEVNTYNTNFCAAGDYFFVANETKYLRMPHFREIHKELIRRLTTEFYNFNKIYLITEVANVSDFSLGISRTENAELIISRDGYFNGDIVDILAANEDFNVERVDGLEHLILKQEGGPIAFRAMKMGLSVKAKDILTQEIYNSADKEIRKYAVELIDNELFHLFPKIEINPANANDFFSWSNMALEDIEIFFGAQLS